MAQRTNEYELPRMMVGPHEYVVDLYQGELRAVKDPSKTIDVFKMEREDKKVDPAYWFWYNAKEMKMERGHDHVSKDWHFVRFAAFDADPDFFKRIGEESRAQEKIIRSGESHYEKPYDQRETLIEERKPRLLPMVNIYGTEFFLDMRLKELRQVDDHTNRIGYNQLSIDEFHHIILFDTRTKNAFNGTYEQARQTDEVKQLILAPLDLLIRDGVKRHEQYLLKTGEFSAQEQRQQTRKKGIGH
jgi:hypothetical protein